MQHLSKIWKSLSILWIYIFGISNPLLTQFPCGWSSWPEKLFCKDVDVCKYLFIYGLCWGENTTESHRAAMGNSSLTYGMGIMYCRNITAELKPTAGKFGLSVPKPDLCLPAWIDPQKHPVTQMRAAETSFPSSLPFPCALSAVLLGHMWVAHQNVTESEFIYIGCSWDNISNPSLSYLFYWWCISLYWSCHCLLREVWKSSSLIK